MAASFFSKEQTQRPDFAEKVAYYYRRVDTIALMPVVTVAGVQVGGLLGGSVVVESVFAWPGQSD